MPRSFRLWRPLETYNRVGDPDAFLRKHRKAMKLEEANEPTLCKCFKVALTGLPSSWYNSLPLTPLDRSANYATNFRPTSSVVNGPRKGQSICLTSCNNRTNPSESLWKFSIMKPLVPRTSPTTYESWLRQGLAFGLPNHVRVIQKNPCQC